MENSKIKDRYAQAGVDIDAGNEFVQSIKPIVSKTFNSNVLGNIGGFAGLYAVNLESISKPILVSSTDGVGTKLKIAFMLDKHDTVGIDLVAMCVNDIIVQGAKPLFFLDYLSMGTLNQKTAIEIVKGISMGCSEANCALIGGETAEMPGFYGDQEYDLAGFVTGIVDADKIIDGTKILPGHHIIGIASSGLHSNGYSLVRRIFFDELKMSLHNYVEEFGRTLGEELLEPTKIYVKVITSLTKNFSLYGLAHITGGGITENLPRILPYNCQAIIEKSSWTPHPIFGFIKKAGNLNETEMEKTFNNGIGMILIVSEKDTPDILHEIIKMGESAYQIGRIEKKIDGPAIQLKS